MIERERTPHTPYVRAMSAVASAVAVFSGIIAQPAFAKAKPETPTFQGEIETEDDGTWVIDCYGSKRVRIRFGDTISSLVAKHTFVVPSGAIEDTDIPSEAINEVVAEMNNIDDPDVIYAGKKITMPKRCQPGVIR